MMQLTSENFNQMISGDATLVVFGADWCGDCRIAKPITEELAGRYEGVIQVAELNVDNEKEIAGRYDIKSIPTFILFKDGQVIASQVNVRQVEVLEDMIRDVNRLVPPAKEA